MNDGINISAAVQCSQVGATRKPKRDEMMMLKENRLCTFDVNERLGLGPTDSTTDH